MFEAVLKTQSFRLYIRNVLYSGEPHRPSPISSVARRSLPEQCGTATGTAYASPVAYPGLARSDSSAARKLCVRPALSLCQLRACCCVSLSSLLVCFVRNHLSVRTGCGALHVNHPDSAFSDQSDQPLSLAWDDCSPRADAEDQHHDTRRIQRLEQINTHNNIHNTNNT